MSSTLDGGVPPTPVDALHRAPTWVPHSPGDAPRGASWADPLPSPAETPTCTGSIPPSRFPGMPQQQDPKRGSAHVPMLVGTIPSPQGLPLELTQSLSRRSPQAEVSQAAGRELPQTESAAAPNDGGACGQALGTRLLSPHAQEGFQPNRPAPAAASTPLPWPHPALPGLPCSIAVSYCSCLLAPSILPAPRTAGESRACPVPQFPLLCGKDGQGAGVAAVNQERHIPEQSPRRLFLPLLSGKWLLSGNNIRDLV